MRATVGGKAPSGLGSDALLDFRMEVTLDGEMLTRAEIEELLAKSDGLALVRGRWVEVDAERLKRMIEHFEKIERDAAESGIELCGSHAHDGRRRCRSRPGADGRHRRLGSSGRRTDGSRKR